MADGVNIDWGLLNTPDYVGDYKTAFQAGRQIGAQRLAGNSPAPTAVLDPSQGSYRPTLPTPIQGGEPVAAGQGDPVGQPAGGDQAMLASKGSQPSLADLQARIDQMTPQQRVAASQAQEQFAAILNGLKMQTTDPGQRLDMARHIAGLHPEFGIQPETISPDDVSDQGIAMHVAAAMSLKARIEAARPRYPADGVSQPTQNGNGAVEAWERAAFYQRAAALGMSARAIDNLWSTYAAFHHGMTPAVSAALPATSTGQTSPRAMSDEALLAALRLHGVAGVQGQRHVTAPAPGLSASAHTLSDDQLKSFLEF
jgi:hypothetical protein